MAAALSGTARDRNTIIRSRTDSRITAPTNQGNRLARWSDRSMYMAVWPPT
jgi:hypothetical protein